MQQPCKKKSVVSNNDQDLPKAMELLANKKPMQIELVFGEIGCMVIYNC